MMLANLFGAVLVAALPVQVESAACPSGQEVEQALASMLPSIPETVRPDLAHVFRRDNRLQIVLVGTDAAVIAERWIDDTGACAELAELIAVVIASWESDVHPEFTRSQAVPIPAVRSEKPIAPPSPPAPKAAAFYEVAAGLALSWSDSPALAGNLAMGWFPQGAGPGLYLSAAVESTRTLALAPGAVLGQAIWRRWTGSAEFDWRLPGRAWTLDLHGGLALGWLAASGTGFAQNHSAYSFSPGGAAGVRLSRQATRRISVWVGLAASYWPRKQLVYGQPDMPQQEIPHYQGLASIGLAFGGSPSGR
jgi:hypothetical protein